VKSGANGGGVERLLSPPPNSSSLSQISEFPFYFYSKNKNILFFLI